MTIKHIVISGGGPTGFGMLGGIIELAKNNYFKRENIKTIFATSVGAILGSVICLGFNWEDIENYFVNRPWNKAIDIDLQDYLNINTNSGLLDNSLLYTGFKPFLTAKGLDINITLKELYEYSNIEFHCFTTDFNSFKLIDLSYKTFPDLPFIKAVSMSAALPILFKPIEHNGRMYMDGGIMANFPLKQCLEYTKCNKSEVLGINAFNSSDKTNLKENKKVYSHLYNINLNSTLFDYMTNLIRKLVCETGDKNIIIIPNELCITWNKINFENFYKIFTNREDRKKLVDIGKKDAMLFLKYKKNNTTKQTDSYYVNETVGEDNNGSDCNDSVNETVDDDDDASVDETLGDDDDDASVDETLGDDNYIEEEDDASVNETVDNDGDDHCDDEII